MSAEHPPNPGHYPLPLNYPSPVADFTIYDLSAYNFQSTGTNYAADNEYLAVTSSFNPTFSEHGKNGQVSSHNQPHASSSVVQATPFAMQTQMPVGVLDNMEMPCIDMRRNSNVVFQNLSHSESEQSIIWSEWNAQVSTEYYQDGSSSSIVKKNRHITPLKDELGEEEKFLLNMVAEKKAWKIITASYNKKFTKSATSDSLQMLVKRIKEEIRVWSNSELRCLLDEKKKYPKADWKEISKRVSEKVNSKISDRSCRLKWERHRRTQPE